LGEKIRREREKNMEREKEEKSKKNGTVVGKMFLLVFLKKARSYTFD